MPALRMLADYYRGFSTLEVQAVLPYFHEPALLINPQGVIAAPTFEAFISAFTPATECLRTREFGRSELSVDSVQSLSASTTLVTGVARYLPTHCIDGTTIIGRGQQRDDFGQRLALEHGP